MFGGSFFKFYIFPEYTVDESEYDDFIKDMFTDEYYSSIKDDESLILEYKNIIGKLFDDNKYYFMEEVISDFIDQVKPLKSNINSIFYAMLDIHKETYYDLVRQIKDKRFRQYKEYNKMFERRLYNLLKKHDISIEN